MDITDQDTIKSIIELYGSYTPDGIYIKHTDVDRIVDVLIALTGYKTYYQHNKSRH